MSGTRAQPSTPNTHSITETQLLPRLPRSIPPDTRPNSPVARAHPLLRWLVTANTHIQASGLPIAPLDQWLATVPIVLAEGQAPYLIAAIPPAHPLRTTPSWDQLRHAAIDATRSTLKAIHTAHRAVQLLASELIPCVVIKGPASERHTGTPRFFQDIDILVTPADFPRALSTLRAMGLTRPPHARPPWESFDRNVREAVNLCGPDGAQVDLHHRVPPWAFSINFPAHSIIASAEAHTFAGYVLPIASAEDSLVIAALHILNDLWKGRLALQSWRDVLLLSSHLGPHSVERAFRTRQLLPLLQVLAASLAPYYSHVPLLPSPLPPPRRMIRLALLGYYGSNSLDRQAITWAARLPITHALHYILGSAVPHPSYVIQTDGGYIAYWQRCVRNFVTTSHGADLRSRRQLPGPPL